jgi:transposase-like protein
MALYSPETRQYVLKQLVPPSNLSVMQISRDTGIPAPTLYAWKKKFQSQGFIVSAKPTTKTLWDARAKLAALIQTASMNEAERSAYCREKGLYPEQLDTWKETFEALDNTPSPADKKELGAERKKTHKLKKQLRRKDKALAETAALLVLSKKAQAIWGISEDD